MSSDAAGHEFQQVFSLLQEQMQELSTLQQRRAALTATADAADGTVQVTVNAQRTVTDVVIDDSYLDDFEFSDLGDYVTDAAQEAAEQIDQRAAALLAPLSERRQEISSMSDLIPEVPDFGDALNGLLPFTSATPESGADGESGTKHDSQFPTVRK